MLFLYKRLEDADRQSVIPEIFESSGWNVTRIEHHKGHMIPLEHHDSVAYWLKSLV